MSLLFLLVVLGFVLLGDERIYRTIGRHWTWLLCLGVTASIAYIWAEPRAGDWSHEAAVFTGMNTLRSQPAHLRDGCATLGLGAGRRSARRAARAAVRRSRLPRCMTVSWIPATVSSLGTPVDSVATATVGPEEPAALNAAGRAANTAGSSPCTNVLRRPTVIWTPLVAGGPQGGLDDPAPQVLLPQRIDRQLQVDPGCPRLASAASHSGSLAASVCSTERMLPAGSANHAIGGPYSGLGGRTTPRSSWACPRSARRRRRPPPVRRLPGRCRRRRS